MPRKKNLTIENWFLLILIIGVLFIFWKIIEPFALVIVTAITAGLIFSPYHKKLSKKLGNEKFSAGLISILVLTLIVVPLLLLLLILMRQASDVITFLNNPDVASFSLTSIPTFSLLPEFIREQLLAIDLQEGTRFISEWIVLNIGQMFARTGQLALEVVIFFIGFFTILTDSEKLYKQTLALSPLRDTVDSKILQRVGSTIRSVVFGSLLVALIQGVIATIGFLIFSVPGAVVWGMLTAILAPIPLIGTALAIGPVALYYFAIGQLWTGIGLLILLVVVGMTYNLLAPIWIQGKTKMHGFLILISLLGGLNLFGPVGYIIGPSVLAVLLTLIELTKSGLLTNEKPLT